MHQFNFARSLATPTESVAAVLKLRPPASIFTVVVSPAALSPAEANTCGEETSPRLPFVSPEPLAPPPLAGQPPRLAPCRGRRLNLSCKHMLEFTIALATPRCNPCVFLWLGSLILANAGDPTAARCRL
jgi:hypothetical protein